MKNAFLRNTILATALIASPAVAQGLTSLATTAYQDTRGGTTGNVTGTAQLPNKIDIFSFVDTFTSNTQPPRAYGELTVTKGIGKGVGVTADYNAAYSNRHLDDLVRFGITITPAQYNKKIPINFRILPISTIKSGQVVVYGGKRFDKHSIGGFADFNISKINGKPTVVSEVEYSHKITNRASCAIEFRYNGFREQHKFGVAAGIKYQIR